MAKKNLEDDWDDRVSDDLPDEDDSFDEVDITIDYTDRKVLLVDPDEGHAEIVMDILRRVLLNATIEHAIDCEEALEALEEEIYDAVVMDFLNEGFSNSELVKNLNNDPDTLLICLAIESLESVDEGRQYRLEPLKKMFELDGKQQLKA